MVRLFIEQVPDSVQEIKNAFKIDDYNKIKKIAHTIKPMIDMMGIVSLKKEVRELEKNSDKYHERNELNTRLTYFVKILDNVVDNLKKNSK